MCFGCEKVWFRDTVNIFNVCCVHKRAEVPQICYCFRQKYIPERWGWGALDFWVCWDCCENDTIFLLKCFIGAKNYPFCIYLQYISDARKSWHWDNLGTQSFVLDVIFTRNCKMPQQTAMAYDWFFLSSDDQWPRCRSSIMGWLIYKVGLQPIMRANNNMTLCMNLESRQFFESTHKLVFRCAPTHNL